MMLYSGPEGVSTARQMNDAAPLDVERLRGLPNLGALAAEEQQLIVALAEAAWRAERDVATDKRLGSFLIRPLAELRELLVHASELNAIRLTEEAWQRIDAEQDVRVVRFLLGLMLLRLNALPLRSSGVGSWKTPRYTASSPPARRLFLHHRSILPEALDGRARRHDRPPLRSNSFAPTG